MKRLTSILVMGAILAVSLTGCAPSGAEGEAGAGFDAAQEITVVTREAGSGTRDAFVELTGVLEKDDQGNKTDRTSAEAVTIDGTQAVISTVVGNPYAIGYISLGSLNNTVKAVRVDGVEATAQNVKDGAYQLSRPFNIATKTEGLSDAAKDFIDFILSSDGQKVIEDNGYIAVSDAAAYAGGGQAGRIVVAGSSSVSPVMEKLKEAYAARNPNVTIELQTTDSSAGVKAATEGTCDIGMASRALKDSEKQALTETTIAMDGIAVIVNQANSNASLRLEQIKAIFTGEAVTWDAI